MSDKIMTTKEFATGGVFGKVDTAVLADGLGTILVDETDLDDGKVPTYNVASGTLKYVTPGAGPGGSGDMLKADYDTNDDKVVDDADHAAEADHAGAADTAGSATVAAGLDDGGGNSASAAEVAAIVAAWPPAAGPPSEYVCSHLHVGTSTTLASSAASQTYVTTSGNAFTCSIDADRLNALFGAAGWCIWFRVLGGSAGNTEAKRLAWCQIKDRTNVATLLGAGDEGELSLVLWAAISSGFSDSSYLVDNEFGPFTKNLPSSGKVSIMVQWRNDTGQTSNKYSLTAELVARPV